MTPTEIVLIAGMTLVTFLPRWGVMALLGRLEMPKPLFDTLKFVPVAVLAAIIVPEMFLREGQLALSWQNPMLMAGIAAGVVSWRSRNLLLTIAAGMLIFVLWQTSIAPLAAVSVVPTVTPTATLAPTLTATPTLAPGTIELLRPVVLNRYRHDTDAFTQGLLLHEGVFYESTGRVGRSSLRRVEIETGRVLQIVEVPPPDFAEGLALVEDRLIQITWQTGNAYVYDRDSFERLNTFTYAGEGWGLCYDGSALWMSDGSDTLTRRDPTTFEALGTVLVTYQGAPITQLNELECVGDSVYANIWMTDLIVRIEKASGWVTGQIDGSGLLTPEERAVLEPGAVLNGIAYNPAADTFYLTGKLWPRVFEVQLEPVGLIPPPG